MGVKRTNARRILVSSFIPFVLASCHGDDATVRHPAGSGSSRSSVLTATSTPVPPTGSRPAGASGSAQPSGEIKPAGLFAAFRRFAAAPPSIHGLLASHASTAGDSIRDELWVDWPSFRLVERFEGGGEPLVVNSRDGKLFGYHDPLSGDTGVTRSFGEGAFVLAPILRYLMPATETVPSCGTDGTLDLESLLGRPTIHLRCDAQGWDAWVDQATGLVLRQAQDDPGPHGYRWIGFTAIEFDPVVDPSLFDPRSI